MSGPSIDFLARITEDRRLRVDEMRAQVPAHALRAQLSATRPAGRLERALRRGPTPPEESTSLRLLCEFKRASPSKGVLNASADPVSYARLYEAGGAAAISLVTEPDHFQGQLAWVTEVRAAVGLPILLKDFVVDSYQLLDAAVRGADGVLLLAAILSEIQLQRLIGEARLLGLDCLVEVHDTLELKRSLRAGATLLGINHRDLRTFALDFETSRRLLPQVPPMVTAVAESGFSAPADLDHVRGTRCDAVLIGEAFMTSPDPAGTLTAFRVAARG